jgi:ATP-dependent DNA helicase PIF1
MLLKNWPRWKLVNGSLGVVTAFVKIKDIGKEHLNRLSSDKELKDTISVDYKVPVVQFADGTTLAVMFDAFVLEGKTRRVERARREQLPLRLAWALTIHKSQGMTIEYLQFDLKDAFEPQQVYVALSRAKSLQWLQVISFDIAKCGCVPRVVSFYETLRDRS